MGFGGSEVVLSHASLCKIPIDKQDCATSLESLDFTEAVPKDTKDISLMHPRCAFRSVPKHQSINIQHGGRREKDSRSWASIFVSQSLLRFLLPSLYTQYLKKNIETPHALTLTHYPRLPTEIVHHHCHSTQHAPRPKTNPRTLPHPHLHRPPQHPPPPLRRPLLHLSQHYYPRPGFHNPIRNHRHSPLPALEQPYAQSHSATNLPAPTRRHAHEERVTHDLPRQRKGV